jgi:hypothetical protein
MNTILEYADSNDIDTYDGIESYLDLSNIYKAIHLALNIRNLSFPIKQMVDSIIQSIKKIECQLYKISCDIQTVSLNIIDISETLGPNDNISLILTKLLSSIDKFNNLYGSNSKIFDDVLKLDILDTINDNSRCIYKNLMRIENSCHNHIQKEYKKYYSNDLLVCTGCSDF